MRVLVTNDDGIDAEGLRVLAAAALSAGARDVLVAAPHVEASGASASISALADGGRLAWSERALEGLGGVPALAVEASPAAIVLWAAAGAFGDPPDVVLSGVNHGPNAGWAVLHSGTVGAALTGAQVGARSLAVSHCALRPTDWDATRVVARTAVRWVLERGEAGTAVSVNVPDVPLDALRGLRTAPLASAFGAVEAVVADRGEGWVVVSFQEAGSAHPPGSDLALLDAGWATATGLRAPSAATDVPLEGLSWRA